MHGSWRKVIRDEESTVLLHSSDETSGTTARNSARNLLYASFKFAAIASVSFRAGFVVNVRSIQSVCHKVPSAEPSSLQSLDRTLHPNHTNIPLQLGDKKPIWQQTPNPEVDAAWHALTKNHFFLMTEKDLRASGKEPEHYISVPSEYGYGDKKFLARFAHTHNIHCLDHIRRRLFQNHYNYSNTTIDWLHVHHCFHALLDHLTCYVQYDVFNYVWIDGEPWPQPDLTYNRQCRNLSALIDWNEDNRVDRDKRVLYLQPTAGDQILPPDEEYRALEKQMELANPDMPSMHEQRMINLRIHHDAVTHWKMTGEVPMDMDRE